MKSLFMYFGHEVTRPTQMAWNGTAMQGRIHHLLTAKTEKKKLPCEQPMG